MPHKFRIWEGNKMLMPEDMAKTTYRHLLNRDGIVFGIDLSNMKWDGMLRINEEHIMYQIGRKDMKGKEIYEGDVVKVRDWEDGRRWLIGVVEYDKENCWYLIRFDTGDPENRDIFEAFCAQPDCMVLGHKFQPEMQKLIKEQRERFTDPHQEAAMEEEDEQKAKEKEL